MWTNRHEAYLARCHKLQATPLADRQEGGVLWVYKKCPVLYTHDCMHWLWVLLKHCIQQQRRRWRQRKLHSDLPAANGTASHIKAYSRERYVRRYDHGSWCIWYKKPERARFQIWDFDLSLCMWSRSLFWKILFFSQFFKQTTTKNETPTKHTQISTNILLFHATSTDGLKNHLELSVCGRANIRWRGRQFWGSATFFSGSSFFTKKKTYIPLFHCNLSDTYIYPKLKNMRAKNCAKSCKKNEEMNI